jgi:flagellar hook protein FlgE
MASDVSTIQSLKAVDAWIDVINANINGGVRTAFKASRLKFSGSNVDVARTGNATSLPLQFPEPSLTTANTVIDFTQGAITASTEHTHLAIQGDGFFLLLDPASIDATTGATVANANAKFYLTRDGEFRTNQAGLLVHASGYYLVRAAYVNTTSISYDTTTRFGAAGQIRAVFNDLDQMPTAASPQRAVRLTDYVRQGLPLSDIGGAGLTVPNSTAVLAGSPQSLQYSRFGSTVYDIGFQASADASAAANSRHTWIVNTPTGTILTKSLEASNASMTQSVPELSLAQKLFSALTKVLQTKQTNVDGVLNLVR